MQSVEITVTDRRKSSTTHPIPPGIQIFRVRDAVDPQVIDLQGISSASNFAPVKLAGFDGTHALDWNGVKKFQVVSESQLRALQYNEPGEYGSVDKKMNWLMNSGGEGKRPYFVVNGQCRFGSIVFGGSDIAVESINGSPVQYTKFGPFPNKTTKETIPFFRVVGIPDHLIGSAFFADFPYWVTRATAFNSDYVQTYTPRGATHLHYVWNTDSHPANYADGQLYIAKAFLVGFDRWGVKIP